MPKAILETIMRVHDDTSSDYLEIGYEPDSVDTQDLIEIRSYSYNVLKNNWDIGQRVVVKVDSIDLLIQALQIFRKGS